MNQSASIPKGDDPAKVRDGLLRGIARLHPGWVMPIVWLGYFACNWSIEAEPVLAVASFTGFMLLYMSYPLFVLLFLSGRFATWSPPRPGRAVAAFSAIEIIVVAVILIGPDTVDALIDAANAGVPAAILAFAVPFSILTVSFFYLIIGAALVLVAAERGRAFRAWHNLAALLQFFYLPICVFFIHRRIRRLVSDYEKRDHIALDLPIEKLEIEQQASGHLCLVLTERPGWEDFESYAEELLRRLDGRVLDRITAVDTHLWKVEIETIPLLLVYEDSPNLVNLESDSYPGDMLLKKLQARLAPAGATQKGRAVSGPPS